MNNKSKSDGETTLTQLHDIEEQLRKLSITETNSEYKRRLLSARNILSNLIDEMEHEEKT